MMLKSLLIGALLGSMALAPMQVADAPPVRKRIAARSFPSVFQAWNAADNLKGEDPLATMARHDLAFVGPSQVGLAWNHKHVGLATDFTPESLEKARRRRADLLQRNPNFVLLAEIRYRDAPRNYLPEGHAWWKRDEKGEMVPGWEEGGYFLLDLAKPEVRQQVAEQARAAARSGVFDGVLLDWWQDDAERLDMAKRVREALGDDALILVNANDRQIPQTAPYVNGCFMECYRSETPEDWKRIAATLRWAEMNLRAPRINCLETWFHRSRADQNLMRAATTLALTHSDGYCLFSDPNPLPAPDHLHDWYPFWEKSLGRPRAAGKEQKDGSSRREFEKGTAVYNPMGNRPVTVTFRQPRRSAATGTTAREHRIEPADGDLFLAPSS